MNLDIHNQLLKIYKTYKQEIYIKENITKEFIKTKDSYRYSYTLDCVEYNKDTCAANIKFKESIKKSMYSKYNPYKESTLETNYVNKTIVLNPLTINNLDKNNDYLVSYFAEEIILSLDDCNLVPSWLWNKMCDTLLEYIPDFQKNKEENLQFMHESEMLTYSNIINGYTYEVNRCSFNIKKFSKKLEKAEYKLALTSPNIWKCIFTFGIYSCYFKSSSRKDNLDKKISFFKEEISNFENEKQSFIIACEDAKKMKDFSEKKHTENLEKLKNKISKELELCTLVRKYHKPQ